MKTNDNNTKKRTNSRANARSKQNRKARDDNEGKFSKSGYNDASWYAANPQLLQDAASLSFANATGVQLDVGDQYLGNPSNCPGRAVAPGVMAIDVALAPGLSKDNSSAVNVASRQIYSYVVHANSRNTSYNAPDQMLYLLAMDEIYAFYNNMRRAYGVMMSYNIRNRYKPQALVTAMGFDFNDLQSNLADFRYFINQTAAKINTLCVPSTMTYMIRHSWMFSNVYMDSDNPKAQMYVFRQDGYRFYDEFSLPSKLAYTRITNPMKFSDVVFIMNKMLSRIIESEDMNIMSGDILKAYGENNLFRVVGIEANHQLEPVYNPEVLTQIQNATILPQLNAEQLNISYVVDTNTITFNPEFNSPAVGWSLNKILNLHVEAPTPADVMVATRLMIACKQEAPGSEDPRSYNFTVHGMGSEIAMNARMYFFDSTNTLTYHDLNSVLMYQPEDEVPTTLSMLTVLTKFNYHPCIWLTFNNGTIGNTNYDNKDLAGFMFDLDNYTVIDYITLSKMHDTAILSEFGIGK